MMLTLNQMREYLQTRNDRAHQLSVAELVLQRSKLDEARDTERDTINAMSDQELVNIAARADIEIESDLRPLH